MKLRFYDLLFLLRGIWPSHLQMGSKLYIGIFVLIHSISGNANNYLLVHFD